MPVSELSTSECSGGLSQDISIPTWRWEALKIYFILSLARTQCQHDSIWVILEGIMKSSHLIRVKVS